MGVKGTRGQGRKPAPTRLKILKGVHKVNPNRINKNEPVPDFVYPDRPDHLVGHSKEAWDWAVECLSYMKVLTANDLVVIETYAKSYHHWREACERIDELGMVAPTRSGLGISPFLKIYLAMTDKILRCLVELGLTPSSRSRLQIPTENRETPTMGLPQARVRG